MAQILQLNERVVETTAVTTFSASNTTASETMFTLVGAVYVHAIWGEVTTVIAANHTAGFIRLNDATAQIDITDAAGVALSALKVGTMVARTVIGTSPLDLMSNAAGAVHEPAAGQRAMHQFLITKKTAATTVLEYRYSTTDTPTTGAITWHALWQPMSGDGDLGGTYVQPLQLQPRRHW